MNLFLALTPIIIVVVGIVGLKKPAMWVSLIAMIYTIGLVIIHFDMPTVDVTSQTIKGVIEGAKMVFMIWAAFLILNMLVNTKAMDKIKEVIAALTCDKRKQVIIIAFCFGGFLEGVAGAGTPAAIAAPFLVALGIPVTAAVLASLIFNGIAASLGAAGLTTIGGFQAFIDPGLVNVLELGMCTSLIHLFGALIAPLLVLYIIWGKKVFDKEIIRFALITGFAYGSSMVLTATFVGAEFPTICAGVFSLIVAIIYIKLTGKAKNINEEFVFRLDPNAERSKMPALKALASYLILLIVLPSVRFFAPDWFIGLGFAVWIGITITGVCIIGAIILNDLKSMPKYMYVSFLSVFGALVSMASLVALSNLMNAGGLLSIVAKALADVTGPIYPAIAVVIGSLGSFIAGTTTGSNRLFAPLHYEACGILGLSIPPVFAAQNVGGALGNMICTNNVVAVCTTVGLKNSEGIIMQKVFKPFIILIFTYGCLAMLYTYVIFSYL